MSNQTSTATNLTGPNLNTPAATTPNANAYFNNFYSIPYSVSAGTNDALTAFFESYCPNAQAAQNLASAVLYTALAQNLNPMKVLQDFQALPQGQLSNYLAAFLNITRVSTSLLGINYGTKTSPFVARTILA
jgi:hypothetical protein